MIRQSGGWSVVIVRCIFSKICDCEMYSCDSEMYSCDCDCHICDFLIVMNDVVGKEKERKCE